MHEISFFTHIFYFFGVIFIANILYHLFSPSYGDEKTINPTEVDAINYLKSVEATLTFVGIGWMIIGLYTPYHSLFVTILTVTGVRVFLAIFVLSGNNNPSATFFITWVYGIVRIFFTVYIVYSYLSDNFLNQ